MCSYAKALIATATLSLFLIRTLIADTIWTKDGRQLEGYIVKEDDSAIVFDAHRSGIVIQINIKKEDITRISAGALAAAATRPAVAPAKTRVVSPRPPNQPVPPPVIAHAKPTFYFVTLRGEVGTTITADSLTKAMEDAITRKPSAVVIHVESDGGRISEVEKLVSVFSRYKGQLRIAIMVKRAISAAAITAMACDEIYMRETGTIGAATGWRFGPAGTPQNLQEKFESVWRATARSAAETGGHPAILAEAMIDGRNALYREDRNGKIIIASTPAPRSRLIKPAGKLLMMTAQEAVDAGLARGIVDDMNDLGSLMGFKEWEQSEGIGVALDEYIQERLEWNRWQWAAGVDKLKAELLTARETDPIAFQDYPRIRGGVMTSDGLKMWDLRLNKSLAALTRAEKELQKLELLDREFPAADTGAENIPTLRDEIAERKMQLRQSSPKAFR